MKQNVQVHALPTEKASNIRKLQGSNQFQYFDTPVLKYGELAKTHHLYVTTSETPKKGDWVIADYKTGFTYLDGSLCTDGKIVLVQVTKIVLGNVEHGKQLLFSNGRSTHEIKFCRKVVATDDKDLYSNPTHYDDGTLRAFHTKALLPQISPEFQQAWVRKANKGTPIVDAIMEMEERGYYWTSTETKRWVENLQPKLNPQGYVTILPVKEKMYSREELRQLLWQCYVRDYASMSPDDIVDKIIPKFNTWIEQNLQ